MRPMLHNILPPLLAVAALTAVPTVLAEHREHGAHVHGVGQLNVLIDGDLLAIELHTPAMNIVGFEHHPHDSAQRAQLERAIAQLRDGAALFELPAAAGCALESVEVASDLLEPGPEPHAHADVEASYHFRCATAAALNGMEARLFRLFPATEKLDVQLVTPQGQRGAVLTPDRPHLAF